MTAAGLLIRYGIDPMFMLAALWLLAALTAPLIGARR